MFCVYLNLLDCILPYFLLLLFFSDETLNFRVKISDRLSHYLLYKYTSDNCNFIPNLSKLTRVANLSNPIVTHEYELLLEHTY